MKKIIKVTEVKKGTTKTDKETFNLTTEKDGYFSGFVLDYDGHPTPGVAPLLMAPLPISIQVEYDEKPNPKNPQYPFQNVTSVFIPEKDSEYPQINPEVAPVADEGEPTPREKLDILWVERQARLGK